MNNQVYSAYYYPTTIFMVDNDEDFLENISTNLSLSFFTDYSSDIFNALNTIRENHLIYYKKLSNLFSNTLKENDNLSPEWFQLNNLSNINKHLIQKMRCKHISTVIVDYSMPKLNGIEFCIELENLPIKKLMLTGKADHELAVNAFNEGIIDGFILKDSKDMFNKLCLLTDKLCKHYFRDLTNAIPNLILSKYQDINDEYIKLFFDIIYSNNIKEYYQLDDKGSFIFLGEKSQAIWFLIIEKSKLEEYYEIAFHSGADFSVISAIKNHNKIPILIDEEDHRKSVLEWDNLLQPLKKFKSIPDFYYLILNEKQINKLNL